MCLAHLVVLREKASLVKIGALDVCLSFLLNLCNNVLFHLFSFNSPGKKA